MLVRLLKQHLRPYRRWLLAVVGLQLAGTIAALYLPTLNADIIDNGVSTGNTGYILRTGAWMLSVSVVQIACSVVAVYFGARTAMSFGRDVRAALFHQVGTFSMREMAQFGAPSLITRTTNDVQQVQMLVVMTSTMMVAAPIMAVGGVIMAVREDAGLSWLLAVSVPVLAVLIAAIVRRMVPQFRLMQDRIDNVNRVLREQISGVRVVRAFVREPVETERFGAANQQLTDTSRAGRAADGVDLPDGDARAQRLERGRAVVRRVPRRLRRDPGRLAHRVPQLPRADPHVGAHGHVHADDDPARRGVRRAHRRGPRHRLVGRAARRADHRDADRTARSSSATSRSPSRVRPRRCCRASASPPPGARPRPSSAAPAPARRRWCRSSPAWST